MGFRSALTGNLVTPDLKGELSRSQRVFMPQQAKFAYCATRDALRDAGVDEEYLAVHEVGLLYGNDSSAVPVVQSVDIMREKKDTTMCGSGAIFQSMNSTVTMNLDCIFKLKGINLTVSGACASGSHAIGLGALLIQNGLQESPKRPAGLSTVTETGWCRAEVPPPSYWRAMKVRSAGERISMRRCLDTASPAMVTIYPARTWTVRGGPWRWRSDDPVCPGKR